MCGDYLNMYRIWFLTPGGTQEEEPSSALSCECITVWILIFVFRCVYLQPPVREGPVTRSASRAASLHSLSDASSDSFNHSPGEMHKDSFSSCPCFLSCLRVNFTKATVVERSIEKNAHMHMLLNSWPKTKCFILYSLLGLLCICLLLYSIVLGCSCA